jgi:hypothetical protein
VRINWRALLPYLCVVGMALVLVVLDQSGNSDRIDDLAREGAAREDQFCLLTERDHRQDVRSLRATYSYLLSLTPEERQSTLNQLVLRELPKTEVEAKTDAAPKLCDQPGRYGDRNVGLPEPDPRIPKRPPKLKRQIKQAQGGKAKASAKLNRADARVASVGTTEGYEAAETPGAQLEPSAPATTSTLPPPLGEPPGSTPTTTTPTIPDKPELPPLVPGLPVCPPGHLVPPSTLPSPPTLCP